MGEFKDTTQTEFGLDLVSARRLWQVFGCMAGKAGMCILEKRGHSDFCLYEGFLGRGS